MLSPLLILAAALSPALAQDAPANAYNAHGFTLVPDDGHPMDLMSTWRPEAYTPLTFGAQAVAQVTSSASPWPSSITSSA